MTNNQLATQTKRKDWLPKSKEFDDWVGYSPSMAQVVIAVYLIYRGN
ncbi:gp24 [Streptococcus pneumoniae]|nr:gp24 [Streptococcus pneumoniae]